MTCKATDFSLVQPFDVHSHGELTKIKVVVSEQDVLHTEVQLLCNDCSAEG